ncbi:hypothetical protein [Bacillus cereus]|uniref:hypothetical protein n=1 Tax=Bacillus cereus TaxID=1396 RepID=UPI0034D65B05
MSKNLWGDLTNLEEKRNPLDILKEQSGYLLDATNSMIYADLYTREAQEVLGEPGRDFATKFSIKSKVMNRYEFELFTLFYNVTFFPFIAEIDENVSEALNMKSTITLENEEQFYEFLQMMLGNDHTKKVITSLYAMSK